jgi:ribonuclease P/MRP protein subunit RPP40
MIPSFKPPRVVAGNTEDFDAFASDIREWLAMVSLQSPRVIVDDKIDPFLSRYEPPASDDPSGEPHELVTISWQGFLTSVWAHKVFVQALLTAHQTTWFAMSHSSFPTQVGPEIRDCTVLKLPTPNEFVLWEVAEE